MKKTIIITGWAWYLWSHVCVSFQNAWYDVVVIDNFSNSDEKTITNISKITWKYPDYYNADLRSVDELEKIFNFYDNLEWVVHLAWLSSISDSCENIYDYYENNVIWTLNFLNILEKRKIKNVIFGSTWFVYDQNLWNIQLKETDLIEPLSPLASTKLSIEYLLKNYSKYKWFNIICLRNFNTIWAHPSGLLGENIYWINNSLAFNVFAHVLSKKWKVKIYWNWYNTTDGSCVRDYVDVMDMADWYLKSFKFLLTYIIQNNSWNAKEWIYWVLNLWTWRGWTVRDVIQKIENLTKTRILTEVVDKRIWDSEYSRADITRAKEFIWWQPTISIDESLNNYRNFMKNNYKE